MKLYQQADNFTVFNGWYGNCDTECNTLNLNNTAFEPISAIYEFPNNGVGIKSFTGSEYSFLNAFDELICGKAYLIILKPGYGFVEIPNFTLSFAEEQNSLGMISTDCSFEGLPQDDTPTTQSQSGTIFVPMEQDDAMSSSKSTFSTKLGVENYEKCSQRCDSHSLSHSMAKSLTGTEPTYEKHVKIKIRTWQNDGYQEDLVLEAQNDVYHKSGMYLRDGEPYMIVIRVDNGAERYLFIATAEEQDDGTLNINTNGNAITNLKFLALDYGRYKSEILYLIALQPEEEYNDLYERKENYYMGDANESGSVIVMPGSPFYHCKHNANTYRFNTSYASLSGIEPEPTDPTPTPKPIGCTEDAKQCPDGSVVVRDPNNNCEFFPCPETTPTPKSIICPKDIKNCPDGTVVGRNPDDDCNFYPCPDVDCENGYCEFNEETLNYYQAQFNQKSYKRYSFNFRWNCFCHPEFVKDVRITVENDKIVDIINPKTNEKIVNGEVATYYTLNGIFDFIKEAKLEKNADKITFRFNGEHFYMESAGIDYIFLAIDDELGFFVSDFKIDYNYIPTPEPELEIKDFDGIIADFENTPIDDPSRVNLTLEGNVAYLNLEGGFFGITDANGNKYIPVNLQNEILNTEKRYIRVIKGFKKQNQASIWMWGTLIYCEEWELIDDDTPYPQPGPDEKLKILMLHGGGEEPYNFQNQQGVVDLMEALPQFEFVFADAPVNNLWLQDPPGGKDYPTLDPKWADESIDYINELVSQHGSFWGILGFSQGAAFIPVYLANTNYEFKVALMYNGYLPETHEGLMQQINQNAPFETKSMVFIGKNDYNFRDLGYDLYSKFSNGLLVESDSAGHHLPIQSDSTFETIVNFIFPKESSETPNSLPVEPLPVEPFVQSNAFLEYTGEEADRESRGVLGGDDGNTAMYCRVSALIENNTGTPELIVRSNGVPNYTPKVGDTTIVGSWQDELSVSSDGNPNTIGEQDYIFTIPLIDVTQNPVKSEADDYEKIVATGLGPIGISSNGVPLFNPWHNNQNDYLSASRDAMTFATFSSCCGHPSGAGPGRTGAGPYHYHKYPTCIAGNRGLSPTSDIIEEEDMADVIDEKLKKKGSSAHSPILGYMLDGYPVYGPVGTTSSVFTENTSCKILRSSYVLNGENYEYSKGSGDLDKCNAIYSATPEYPNGCYHYVLSIDSNDDGTVKRTENPLYIQRSRDTDEVKYMITPMYPYTTVYFRGSEFGNFRNGDESTSIDPNDDPCAGYGVSWGPGIGPKPEGCNQQPPPM